MLVIAEPPHRPAPPPGACPPLCAVSVFDLDRTLTRRPTYSLFLIRSALVLAPWRLLLVPLLAPVALLYLLRLLPRRRMKEAMHAVTLGRRLPEQTVAALADGFARRLARGGLYEQGLALLAAERAAGRRLVLATAAPHFYAAAIARHLGIADLVATQSRWRDGHLTPAIDGENCHGPAKARRLAHFLAPLAASRAALHVRFYTDDASDLPALAWCDEAVAVNPGAKLRHTATERGWRILDWR